MYYVVDKVADKLVTFAKARDVAIYLLGRRLRNYVIIKAGEPDKLYIPDHGNSHIIELELEAL